MPGSSTIRESCVAATARDVVRWRRTVAPIQPAAMKSANLARAGPTGIAASDTVTRVCGFLPDGGSEM